MNEARGGPILSARRRSSHAFASFLSRDLDPCRLAHFEQASIKALLESVGRLNQA